MVSGYNILDVENSKVRPFLGPFREQLGFLSALSLHPQFAGSSRKCSSFARINFSIPLQ